jgi:hypothetical protein
MKKALYIIFLLVSYFSQGQYNNPVASQMSTKFIQADEYIGKDAFDYDYFIKNNTLFKLKNNEKFQYKNVGFGKITKVDLQNALRIVLFYENYNMIVALDNQLNEVEKLNLSQTDYNLVAGAVGTAAQNNYWIYNTLTQRFGLYNFTKESFKYISVPFEKGIKEYNATFNLFYWIDQNQNLHTCSLFGKITALGKFPEYDQVHLTDEGIIAYKKGSQLFLYDILEKKSTPIENIEKSIISFYYKNQNLAIFTAEGITNYKINLP